MIFGRLPALLVAVTAALVACDPEPSSDPSTNVRGVRRGTPTPAAPAAPAEPRTFRADPGSTTGTGSYYAPRAGTPAATADGGLPMSDGGPVPTDDHALAAAVEAHGRELARCFPATMSSLPVVTLEFQISVSGIVTRAEARGEGVPPAVQDCLSSAAAAMRFPGQDSVRQYRYPIRLRRTPAADGGPAGARADGGR